MCVTLWRLCCASLEEGVCVWYECVCVTLATLLRRVCVCHALATLLCKSWGGCVCVYVCHSGDFAEECVSLSGDFAVRVLRRVCVGSLYSLDWTTGLDYWTGFSQQCGLPEQRRC